VLSPLPQAVAEDGAGATLRGLVCFSPGCLALAWTGVGPCYSSPSLPEHPYGHQALIPRDSLLLVAPLMWCLPEGAGRQQGWAPSPGFVGAMGVERGLSVGTVLVCPWLGSRRHSRGWRGGLAFVVWKNEDSRNRADSC